MSKARKRSRFICLPYLNFAFEPLQSELAYQPAVDSMDHTHLNYHGAVKLTSWLGQHLHDKYNLPDHRGDPAYASWEQAARHFASLTQLRNSTDILSHLEAAASDKDLFTVVMSGGAMDTPVDLPQEVTGAFRAAGLTSAPASAA